MATSMGEAKDKVAEINVTPMIDILLVLLIIFMVIVPAVPKGLEASLPQPPKSLVKANDPIVVQVFGHQGASPSYRINDADVAHAQLLAKLTEIFANRAERTMFLRSDDGVSFAYVADVINIGKAANAMHIGLMTPKTQADRVE
jgi:biopolymer transport protein TolR